MNKKAKATDVEWFVFYTLPNTEKKATRFLTELGYAVYLPCIKQIRKWKNRQVKEIVQPVFPGYVFINISKLRIHEVVKIPQIVSVVFFNGKPAAITTDEIERIKKICEHYKHVYLTECMEEGEEIEL